MTPLFSAELLDALPDAIVWMQPVADANGRIVDFEVGYANQLANEITNHPSGNLSGLCILRDGIPSMKGATANFQHFLAVFESGEPKEFSFLAHHSGRRLETLRKPHGGGVLSTTRDRTAHHEAVRRMEQQKALLDNVLQHSSNGISVGEAVRDSEGKIIDFRTIIANEAACRFTGIPQEFYLSKTGGELDPNFTTSPYFLQCVQCMETGEPFITQYYLQPANCWLEVSVSKMNDEHQIFVFTDVTTTKEAQLATERSAAQLQAIIDRTQSGIFTAAPVFNDEGKVSDFRFVLANRALSAYINQNPEQLTGRLGSESFTGYKTNGLFDLFCDTYLNGRVNRFDFHYNADGIDAWIDMMCTRYENEILVTFTDYTPVKLLQLRLQKTVDELKHSNQSLEAFAYTASHDLQEPLRKIHTFADKLRLELSDHLTSTQRMMFSRMENAALRMRQLIDDLLSYSQVSRARSEFKAVALNKTLEAVLHDLETRIQETGATINITNLPAIKGDERQLRQLFQNLLGNALKYRKPDVQPLIDVRCSLVKENEKSESALEEADVYMIEVSDNGIGFAPEHAESIFEIFHRLHGRAEYEGTGIGLAIVQRVVQNHHGKIRAEGKPGEGAVFRVYLPA